MAGHNGGYTPLAILVSGECGRISNDFGNPGLRSFYNDNIDKTVKLRVYSHGKK